MGIYDFKFNYLTLKCTSLIIPHQDLKKDHDKEKMTINEASKVKKEVARGGKCWKNIWLGILSVTGELFNCLTKTSSCCFAYQILYSVEGFIDSSSCLGMT